MAGLVGVICEDDGQQYPFDECIACSLNGGPRRCNFPPSLMIAMARNKSERKDAGISATAILDCPRKVILTRETDYHERPSAYWARFRGTIGHLMHEHYAPDLDHIVQEVRRRKTIDVDGVPVEITGKPDWVDVERGLIVDFKSVKSVNVKPIKDGLPKEGHTEQVNVYAWLCAGGTNMDTGEIEHFEIAKGGIQYFCMSGTVKVGVDIWPLDETEAFVRERLRPQVRYQRTGELPPFWRDERGNRHVLCNYCPVREVCDERGESGGG